MYVLQAMIIVCTVVRFIDDGDDYGILRSMFVAQISMFVIHKSRTEVYDMVVAHCRIVSYDCARSLFPKHVVPTLMDENFRDRQLKLASVLYCIVMYCNVLYCIGIVLLYSIVL